MYSYLIKKIFIYFEIPFNRYPAFQHLDPIFRKNLIQAVEKCIWSDFNFRIYNVTDEPVYQLREVIERLVNGIFENPKPVQEINLSVVKLLAKTLSVLRIPFPITPMSINTITRPSILSIKKIQTELEYQPKRNFQNASTEIINWVKQVGIEKVMGADKELPWDAAT